MTHGVGVVTRGTPMKLEVKHRGQWSATPSTLLERAASRFDKRHWDDVVEAGSRRLLAYADEVRGTLRDKHSGAWPGGTSEGSLSVRSGGFQRALSQRANLYHIPGGYEARFSIPGYMGIHERGGVIRPRRARYLTIPLPAALDTRGVALRARARDWPNTFVAKSRAGNLIIFQKRGRRDVVPLYVLKKSVRIPPRLGLTRTLMMHRPRMLEDLRDYIRIALSEQADARRGT